MTPKISLALQLAITLLLISLIPPLFVYAQSNPQQPEPTKPKDSVEEDLISADRPGIADGSSVIGARRIQVEAGGQWEFRRFGDDREHTFLTPALLRIGITKHWEARIEGSGFVNTSDSDLNGQPNHLSGLSPLSFGTKYQFQESNGVKHPSLGAILRIFPELGTSNFRTHHVTGDLRFAADWDVAPKLSLNPNVGVGYYEDGGGRSFAAALFAVTLSYAPTKKLNPFIDVGLQGPEEKHGKTGVIVDGGVAYILGRNVQLDASVGTGAHGNTQPHPFVAIGISFRSHPLGRGK